MAVAGAQSLPADARQKGILLSDLSQLAAPGTISREDAAGTWHAVDYEIDEGKGVMLFGEPESKARPLTLSLGRKG